MSMALTLKIKFFFNHLITVKTRKEIKNKKYKQIIFLFKYKMLKTIFNWI